MTGGIVVASVAGVSLYGFLRGFSSAQRFRDQRVGEYKPCFAHVVDWDQRFLAGVLAFKPRSLARDAQQNAAEALSLIHI